MTFRENNFRKALTLGADLHAVDGRSHETSRSTLPGFEFVVISIEIFDFFLSHTRFHRGFRDSRGHPQQHSWIKWFWDQVVGAEFEFLSAIGDRNTFRNIFSSEFGESVSRRQFHFFIDGGRTNL